jgi:HK97 family phage prohead protease
MPTAALPQGLLTRATEVRLESPAEGAGFDGWACRSDRRDAYGTEFAPGCWGDGTESLAERTFPLCWFHDPSNPLGTLRAEDREDGLWITGGWDDTPEGQTGRERARTGSAPALSVGFVPLVSEWHDATDVEPAWERFLQCRLIEVSQITLGFQAVPDSEFASARALVVNRPPDPVSSLPDRGLARSRLLLARGLPRRAH